jgi:hypothetical protein
VSLSVNSSTFRGGFIPLGIYIFSILKGVLMILKNYTPHEVSIFSSLGEKIETLPTLGIARVLETTTTGIPVNGIPVVSKKYSEVTGLPEPEDGVIFVVSQMVLSAMKDRRDIMCPDTGSESSVRDSEGKLLGVRRLQCAPAEAETCTESYFVHYVTPGIIAFQGGIEQSFEGPFASLSEAKGYIKDNPVKGSSFAHIIKAECV